jgi:hypothetical protein
MKKLLIVMVGLFVGSAAFAQSSNLGFGLKAGVNFPKYNISGSNNSYETSAATNFHVTGYLDAPLSSGFSIQPGISLQGKGAKIEIGNLGSYTQSTMWLEVPVNFVAKVPVGNSNFFLGAGPYIGFGLSGKNKYESSWGSVEEDFEFGKDGSLKSTDFGVNFTAGFHINRGLLLHAGYGLGLTDLAPNNNSDMKMTNRVFSVGLGFAL